MDADIGCMTASLDTSEDGTIARTSRCTPWAMCQRGLLATWKWCDVGLGVFRIALKRKWTARPELPPGHGSVSDTRSRTIRLEFVSREASTRLPPGDASTSTSLRMTRDPLLGKRFAPFARRFSDIEEYWESEVFDLQSIQDSILREGYRKRPDVTWCCVGAGC